MATLIRDRPAEHASKVAIWCVTGKEPNQPVYRIQNNSGLPTFQVVVYYKTFSDEELYGLVRFRTSRLVKTLWLYPEPYS